MAEFLTDDIDFESYLNATDAHANVKPATAYVQPLKDRLKARKQRRFVYLPWEKTKRNFDFRGGEVTVWAGQNGHGKSHITRIVALSLVGQGEKVCIANFEAKPVVTLQAMARMFTGVNPFSDHSQSDSGIRDIHAQYDRFGEWTDGKLWLYDQNGTTQATRVLGMARYCATELGVTHVFIDNLAKCVKNEDDYNGQKSFVDECTAIARDTGCHIHIVHHLKKPERETDKPDKGHVKGSGSIVDQPDNLMLVYRNKAKEDDRKAGSQAKADEPDQAIYCKKQRNYEGTDDGEPTISLWLVRESSQFVGSAHESDMQFDQPYPHRTVSHVRIHAYEEDF